MCTELRVQNIGQIYQFWAAGRLWWHMYVSFYVCVCVFVWVGGAHSPHVSSADPVWEPHVDQFEHTGKKQDRKKEMFVQTFLSCFRRS